MAKYSKATTPALRGTNLYESQGRAKVAKLKRLKGVGVLALGGLLVAIVFLTRMLL